MKLPTLPLSLALVFVCLIPASAQRRGSMTRVRAQPALVIDESVSVLRREPSLYAFPVQRLRIGRRVQTFGSVEADGVKFYKVTVSKTRSGWLQTDAVVSELRPDDEIRFVRSIQTADGFDQLLLASEFLKMYPRSAFRASMLLLFGDLAENAAVKLSRDAVSKLGRRPVAISGLPLHSVYLNFAMLDRFRKLGLIFLFNSSTKQFHYNGWSWSEIVKKYSATSEASEAQKRLVSLRSKLEKEAS